MADSLAMPEPMTRLDEGSDGHERAGNPAATVSARVSHHLADVEDVWRTLEQSGIDSPGQSFGFTQLWIEAHGIAERDQFFIVGEIDRRPVALLPLHRRSVKGVRQLAWFPGTHVGCNAPLVDRGRLASADAETRAALWRTMLSGVTGADLVYLKAVPELMIEGFSIFGELGTSLVAETLYRAEFSSWDEANTTQRSKSRRKHDRQQGEKLEALGAVAFEELGAGGDAKAVLDVMFRQRAARFREMGVDDPFDDRAIRAFYDATARPGSPVDIRLHVLRLDNEIVAVRYNVVHEGKLFCLISSMSDDPAIQGGSPGKQCLLRVMQTVFDQGYATFDMGAGFTDEKRHWCNVQIPVRVHYVPLTPVGTAAAGLHRSWQVSRKRIKENKALLGLIKWVRTRLKPAKPRANTAENDD